MNLLKWSKIKYSKSIIEQSAESYVKIANRQYLYTVMKTCGKFYWSFENIDTPHNTNYEDETDGECKSMREGKEMCENHWIML